MVYEGVSKGVLYGSLQNYTGLSAVTRPSRLSPGSEDEGCLSSISVCCHRAAGDHLRWGNVLSDLDSCPQSLVAGEPEQGNV